MTYKDVCDVSNQFTWGLWEKAAIETNRHRQEIWEEVGLFEERKEPLFPKNPTKAELLKARIRKATEDFLRRNK